MAYPEPISIEEAWEMRYRRLHARLQEAATLLDFEANLGDPKRAPVLREIVRQLTEVLED